MIAWLAAVCFAAPVSVDEVVGRALASDPEVARAAADVEAARGALAASRWLRENPTVDGAVGFGVPAVEVGVTQPITVATSSAQHIPWIL